MAIDFTKPIRHKQNQHEVKIVYHDEKSVLLDYTYGTRMNVDICSFKEHFENIPEPKERIKGFIGISHFNGEVYHTTKLYPNKEILLKNCSGYDTIVEIDCEKGSGLDE